MKGKTELPVFTKTLKEVLREIEVHYGKSNLNARVTYFKIDVKKEFSMSSLAYNEREVNKNLILTPQSGEKTESK